MLPLTLYLLSHQTFSRAFLFLPEVPSTNCHLPFCNNPAGPVGLVKKYQTPKVTLAEDYTHIKINI